MKNYLMKCGHVATSKDKDGNPICVICVGLTPNAKIIEKELPDLTGRTARCSMCGKPHESDYSLAFFKYNEEGDEDSYYCGCLGWD